jgi:hypothetical protein
MANNTLYACLSLNNLSITLFTTKNQVADAIGCHRNTLLNINTRLIYGDYIITEVPVNRCKRGRRS